MGYDEKVRELVRALRGERPGPPAAGSPSRRPPGTGYRAGGTLYRRLAIDRETATLHGGDEDVSARRPGAARRRSSASKLQKSWPS